MSEESTMMAQESRISDGYMANVNIPYFLIDEEAGETRRTEFFSELGEISKLYQAYQKGAEFSPEGSNGDYVASNLKYRKSTMIINKEARFFFSNTPTFNVNPDDVDGLNRDENAILQHFLDKVFEKNNFKGKLLKGLKDCFVAGRVAIVWNFNDDGITINFFNALGFYYEVDSQDENKLIKFVGYRNLNKTESLKDQRWIKKSFVQENDGVWLTEKIFSGNGDLIEELTPRTKILLDYIPAVVVLNDGLTGDINGQSELKPLLPYEHYYSKLANSDMDAERKSMHPIRYTVDASNNSTKNLSTSPGSFWDLQTDQDKVSENSAAKVGTLEAVMSYSEPLKTTLDRIENQMFEEVDVPNITSEQLAGVITSGKTIQALYWGLTVRCDEKMLAWGYFLGFMAYSVIEGGILYPNSIKKYTDADKLPDIPVHIVVENNYPIPEDVKDEKATDMAEVDLKVRSRKSYMEKWRTLSDKKADEELDQIKKEMDMFENSMFNNMDGNSGDEDQDSEVGADAEKDSESI